MLPTFINESIARAEVFSRRTLGLHVLTKMLTCCTCIMESYLARAQWVKRITLVKAFIPMSNSELNDTALQPVSSQQGIIDVDVLCSLKMMLLALASPRRSLVGQPRRSQDLYVTLFLQTL